MDTTLISYTPQSLVQGIAGAATGLTAVLVVIHIISRRVARASVWWDDGFLWFGCGMTLAMNALFIYGKPCITMIITRYTKTNNEQEHN